MNSISCLRLPKSVASRIAKTQTSARGPPDWYTPGIPLDYRLGPICPTLVSHSSNPVARATRTIQAVELGQLPLSKELGMEIAEATGVDFGWLMEGDPSDPPRKGITAMGTGYGGSGTYGRAEFEFHRAFLESPVASSAEVQAAYRAALKSTKAGDKLITSALPVLKRLGSLERKRCCKGAIPSRSRT